MAYLQPKSTTPRYFGFVPCGGSQRTNIYLVSSSEGDPIYPGDVVVMATDKHTARRRTGSSSTDVGLMIGVAASIVLANEGSTAAGINSLSSQNCLIYDDPDQMYFGTDSSSGVLGVGTHVGKSVGVCSTGVVGSTGVATGTLKRSVMALSMVTASSQGMFRVLGIHPIDDNFSTAASVAAASSETRTLMVVPDLHVFSGRGAGAGHITT